MAHTKYIWNPVDDNVIMEKDGNSATTARYTHQPGRFGKLISQDRNGQTHHYHFDGRGNTRALTDESESVTDTYSYSAFGEEVATTGATENPYRYVGEGGYYHDGETDDYYVRARVYAPATGRWVSHDPIGIEGGVNLYLYARNNTLVYADMSGALSEEMVAYNFSNEDIEFPIDPAQIWCGAYHLITRWVPTDGERADGGGLIIQHVCNAGRPELCPPIGAKKRPTEVTPPKDWLARVWGDNAKKKNKHPCDTPCYFELWRVVGDRIVYENIFDFAVPDTAQDHGIDNFLQWGFVEATRGRSVQTGEAWFIPHDVWWPQRGEIGRVFHAGGKGVKNAGTLYSACDTVKVRGILARIVPRHTSRTTKRVDRAWNCCVCRRVGVEEAPFTPGVIGNLRITIGGEVVVNDNFGESLLEQFDELTQ